MLDNITKEIEKMEKENKKEQNITLTQSKSDKFSKKHEIVVLKKHIFEIQKVSDAKVVLKIKRKLNDTDTVPDGVYIFTDANNDNEVLLPRKVFAKFDANAKKK